MTSVAVPVPSAPVVRTRTTEKRVSRSSGSFARARARKMEVEASVQRQMQEMWDMGVVEKGLERQLQAELKRLMLVEENQNCPRLQSPVPPGEVRKDTPRVWRSRRGTGAMLGGGHNRTCLPSFSPWAGQSPKTTKKYVLLL